MGKLHLCVCVCKGKMIFKLIFIPKAVTEGTGRKKPHVTTHTCVYTHLTSNYFCHLIMSFIPGEAPDLYKNIS